MSLKARQLEALRMQRSVVSTDMNEKIKLIAFLGACALVPVFVFLAGTYYWQEQQRVAKEQVVIERSNWATQYTRGFTDGMKATLRHVILVSNQVEIAPILEEMKP